MKDYQIGFHANRSTIFMTYLLLYRYLKNIMKCYEYNIDLFNILIHFNNAFDSVPRNRIIDCPKWYEVPNKLIRLVVWMLHKTGKIKINNNISDEFNMKCVVKHVIHYQWLFRLAINFNLKNMIWGEYLYKVKAV